MTRGLSLTQFPHDDRVNMSDLFARVETALRGRYEVRRELGQGGMAVVFLAEDLKHRRPVAVKVLRPELVGAVAADRFLREIEIAAGLNHPNIVPVFDSGKVQGIVFFVMPFEEGETLREKLAREGTLSVPQAIETAMEVAEALSHAHSRGVIHRDIKPENILVSSGHAVVADFGVARAIEFSAGSTLTASGLAVGTPAYMSPEQAAGDEGALDPRSDLYSLGCVLYELLGGEPPFQGSTPQVVLARQVNERPLALRTLRPTVPEDLERVVGKALAKVRADRFSSAEEFKRALSLVQPGDVGSTSFKQPAGTAGSDRVPKRGHGSRKILASIRALPLPATLSVLFVALVLVAAIVWLRDILDPPGPPLDPNGIAVFPPRSIDHGGVDARGEEVATVVGYTLEGTEPLRWLETRDWLTAEEASGAEPLTEARKAELTAAHGVAHYLDGTILETPDSATLILRLFSSTEGDPSGNDPVFSLTERSSSTVPAGSVSYGQQAIRLIGPLFWTLLGPGEGLEPPDLQNVDPAAMLNWSQGETAYRERRLEEALGFFDRALAVDSTLALAALGGAKAASWSAQDDRARELISVALDHESRLPPRFVPMARGLDWYLEGQADSAVHFLRQALDRWPESADTWALLGDVYNGIVLAPHAVDSARAAYAMAHRYRPDFAPALQMLTLFSALDGEVDEAEGWYERFLAMDPDAETEFRLGLILRCVRDGPRAVRWDEVVRENPTQVLLAGYLMAAGAAQPSCAEPALRSILALGPAATSERWSAVLTLQSLLVAQGRYAELPTVLAAEPNGRYLYLLDAAAGVPVQDSARSVATDLSGNLEARTSSELWILGQYYLAEEDWDTLSALASQLRAKASTSQSRQVHFLSEAMSALEWVAQGDSARAIEALAGLQPNGSLAEIQWRPWEPLASEWMELARLYLAAGNPAQAISVLNRLDHPRPVINLVFLPLSLRLRIEAARQLGDESLAASYRSRLSALQAHSAGGAYPPPHSPEER